VKKITLSIVIVFCFFLCSENDAYGRKRRRNEQTSCAIQRGKYTQADLVVINYGLKIGENLTTIRNTDDSGLSIITGIQAGAVVQVVWPKGFVFQPEVLYSKKGCIFRKSSLEYKIDYVEVPLNFMYRLHMADVKPFVIAGPYGAYAIRKYTKNEAVKKDDDMYVSQIKDWDYGISAGAGFDVWKIQLSFKYNWSLDNIIKDDKKSRNNTLSLSVGLLF
jgi:hypothetical protein